MKEDKVRSTLHLGDDDRLQERGVYPPPPADDLITRSPQGGVLPAGEIHLGDEWLSDLDLEEHFSEDSRLGAALPRGRVVRLDVDPRVLVFEDIPEPISSEGTVAHSGRTWVMDARSDQPTALALPARGHDVVFFAEEGEIRVYALQRA